MTRWLALHQITAMEASPVELVAIAADVGCQGVVVFTHVPAVSLPDGKPSRAFPLVTADTKRAMQQALRARHISVGNVEFFPIKADVAVESYRDGLALGGELGAARAVTHVHDTDPARAVENLGRLADLALEYGLSLGLEFMGLTPGCDSIHKAAWFVEQVKRPNLAIAVDALHLARTGGTPADIAALPAHYFAYSQICDGRGLHRSTDYLPEALDRLMPGDGDFPLLAMIEALPLTAALDVEVPSPTLANQGVPAPERARRAVQLARGLVARANVTR
jgi:sugar phosphate isomerase/epimerase